MSDVTPNRPPMGGTEIILGRLQAALPELTSQVQIIMSRPEQVVLDPAKPKILWLQDLPQDPASACLKDATFRTKFNRIVFASHWQQQQYAIFLGIPFREGVVIKNGVPAMNPAWPKPRDEQGRLHFVYHSTPHRGLAVLAAAAEALVQERQDWVLDVYSSLKIYGWDEQDKQFEPLYEQLRKNPCVNYIGSVPNDQIREALLASHIWCYPSVYQETSCMSAMEALMAGNLGITTNFGALIETCAEWTWMFQVDERPEVLAMRTHMNMRAALDRYDDPDVQEILKVQSLYYQNFYAFETRIPAWKALLEGVIAEGPRQEMLVIE